MDYQVKETHVVETALVLTLSQDEAKWLHSAMQNPLGGDDPDQEYSRNHDYRLRFFEATKQPEVDNGYPVWELSDKAKSSGYTCNSLYETKDTIIELIFRSISEDKLSFRDAADRASRQLKYSLEDAKVIIEDFESLSRAWR